MGGNEWGQGEKAREHGADVLSCADNPSGEACQLGIAENKAYAGALASAGLIYCRECRLLAHRRNGKCRYSVCD